MIYIYLFLHYFYLFLEIRLAVIFSLFTVQYYVKLVIIV